MSDVYIMTTIIDRKNSKKYIDLYYSRAWKDKFPVMPRILVITDKKVKTDSKLDITVCKLDLSDLIF